MRQPRAPLFLALALAACGLGDKGKTGHHEGGDGDRDDAEQMNQRDANASDWWTDNDGGAGGDGDDSHGDGDGRPEGATDEVCDGIDNDLDGQTDDIDVEGDGVCDCLNIATIGQIGPWSDGGNVFKAWLDSRSPVPAVELGDQVLTDDLLRPYQIIVLLHVGNVEVNGTNHVLTPHHEFTADEAAALARWVRTGGGLMTTIGYGDENTEVVNANRLLTPLGMGYSTTNKDTDGDVTQWEVHPLSENVTRVATHNGVQPEGTAATTLAKDADGRVALQVGQVDAGRVVVWGDEWITYDSEWKDTSGQQVGRLWLNMLKWMSPPKVCQVALPPPVIL